MAWGEAGGSAVGGGDHHAAGLTAQSSARGANAIIAANDNQYRLSRAAERFEKQRRLQHLRAELARTEAERTDRRQRFRGRAVRQSDHHVTPDGQVMSYTLTRALGRAGRYLTAAWATPAWTIAVDADAADNDVFAAGPVVGVDLNDGHLAIRRLDTHGNPGRRPGTDRHRPVWFLGAARCPSAGEAVPQNRVRDPYRGVSEPTHRPGRG